MNDHAVGLVNILEAAVHDRIGALCRQAYVHELRGGLQAIHSSMELMARAAGVPENPSLARKASEFAKRAIATHEGAIVRVLDEILAQQHDDGPQPVDLGALARDCGNFLQNPAAARGVRLLLEAEEGLIIQARRQKLRTSILGVILSALRGLTDGSTLRVAGLRRDRDIMLRFEGAGCDALSIPEPVALVSADLDALIVPVARRVIEADGGRLWREPDAAGAGALCFAYPSP
jgi:hypothetical protein